MAFAVKIPLVRNYVFFFIALTVVFLAAANAYPQRANPEQAKMSAPPKLGSPTAQSSNLPTRHASGTRTAPSFLLRRNLTATTASWNLR